MSGTGFNQVKIQEKVNAIPGERIRAVGMCFYKPVKELTPGNSYRLCRNPQNPRDSSCIEVKDGTRVRATLNKDFAHLLASYLDTNAVEEPTCLVLEDARWSRGDSGRPARSHKVTISIQVIPSKIHVIEDAFQLYDLTVVQ
ncbi:uncharacterized protein LOC122949599 [Acropora millepora]|uniref:uncharacterized protein LOC122949599 n=1 Tax=Acropora millepora TaxID=45264 RepID=UPI001CF272ED|nr:uncharacterized protein LOC122949599 [Acropora millepora]